MNRPDYKPPRNGNPPADDEPDWDLIKDVAQHGIAEPIVAGTFFAIAWLGTFYLLKKKIVP